MCIVPPVPTVLVVGAVYGHMKKPMKTLYVENFQIPSGINNFSYRWAPGKDAMNSVHIDDVAGSAWACAEWMAKLGRKEANALAGEEIIFHNDKKFVAEVNGMVPHNKKLIAPMFNVVSSNHLNVLDHDTTQKMIYR
jgi:hypothetical protein